MACPTCDHTMHAIGYGVFHCPRCGTIKTPGDAVTVPGLVDRCRRLVKATFAPNPNHSLPTAAQTTLHALGIVEAINVPADRPE